MALETKHIHCSSNLSHITLAEVCEKLDRDVSQYTIMCGAVKVDMETVMDMKYELCRNNFYFITIQDDHYKIEII